MNRSLPQQLCAIACSSLLLLALAGFVRPASAQTIGGKWEVEFHAGGMLVGNPTGGSPVTLPVGETFIAGIGPATFPSRRVSSWYFGDGATLLTQVAASQAAPFRTTPLDPVLSARLAEWRDGGSFGVRLSRALNARIAAEFSFDYSLAQLEITGDTVRAIEASRGSFVAALYQHLGPIWQPRVTSTADIRTGDARQLVSIGTVNINLKTDGTVIPYVTAGGGVVSRIGTTPSATLEGTYQFMPFNVFPINESDTVVVRDARPDHSFVVVVGAGVRLRASPRWGVRFDARALVGRNKVSTLLDANPSVALGTPALLTWSGTTPSIQFANQLPPRSSLSGPRLEGVETFQGSGAHRQLSVTAGVYWRF